MIILNIEYVKKKEKEKEIFMTVHYTTSRFVTASFGGLFASHHEAFIYVVSNRKDAIYVKIMIKNSSDINEYIYEKVAAGWRHNGIIY